MESSVVGSPSKPGKKKPFTVVMLISKDDSVWKYMNTAIANAGKVRTDLDISVLPPLSDSESVWKAFKEARANLLLTDMDLLYRHKDLELKNVEHHDMGEEVATAADVLIDKFYMQLASASESSLIVGFSSTFRERRLKLKVKKQERDLDFLTKAKGHKIVAKPSNAIEMEALIMEAINKLM